MVMKAEERMEKKVEWKIGMCKKREGGMSGEEGEKKLSPVNMYACMHERERERGDEKKEKKKTKRWRE